MHPALSLLLLPLATTALFEESRSCAVEGYLSLSVKVLSTDKLSCRDAFGLDKPDPYAVVTVGDDSSGTSQTTRVMSNTYTPKWDETLDYGCVKYNSPIHVTVLDKDWFGTEHCLGPLDVVTGKWPAAGTPETVCADLDTHCVTFELFYTAPPPSAATTDAARVKNHTAIPMPVPHHRSGNRTNTTTHIPPGLVNPTAPAGAQETVAVKSHPQNALSSANPEQPPQNSSKGLSNGVIAAITIFTMAGVGLLVGGLVMFYRRRNGNRMRPLRQDDTAQVGPTSNEHEPRHLGPEAELAIL